jgi:DNA-binding NarL/FixJ family response regulator
VTGRLPCTGRPELFDAVLWPEDDTPAPPAAVAEAAALCARCPARCDQAVTATTQPRPVTLLADDWLPPASEGVPTPEVPTFGGRRHRQPAIATGRDYVRPHQRETAWARMAAELADAGRTVPDIAAQLCVSEDTVRALLARQQHGAAA